MKRRILLVDDELAILLTLRAILEERRLRDGHHRHAHGE
jgi:hypothetical protein